MLGRELRDRQSITLDLIGVAGLTAFVLGLTWLRTSEQLGFDPVAALDGVLSQLPVTGPAAVLAIGAVALELGAGLVLARLARARPFDSIAEALLAAMVATVLKGTFLLGTLAAGGLFVQPVLIAIDVALLVAAIGLPPLAGRVQPIADVGGGWRAIGGRVGSVTLVALVGVVWLGPAILQLASPVVPFIDVLPNYVAPVEHLRTFGWFEPLTATQSPIHGPSRSVLGYDGLLGSVATIADLPGGLALAGFVLPELVLVGAGAHRLASAVRDGDVAVGPWALLAFALSQPFARLADARGTVVVVPLVCLGLALIAEQLAAHGHEDRTDPWRAGRGAMAGLALGAAVLVHPVIGFLAITTVAVVALLRPRELAPAAFVAGVTAALVALPQATTMLGLALPTLTLGAWLPIALAVAAGLGLVARSDLVATRLIGVARAARWVVLAALVGGVALAFAVTAFDVDRLDDALASGAKVVLESSGLLLVVLATGLVLGSRGARSVVVLAGLGVGVAALAVVALLPGDLGLLGDALRFEVPKTIHYWLSAIAAGGAGAALAHIASTGRLHWVARAAMLGAFVVVAAMPLRVSDEIDSYHLGEHRWAETFAIDLKYAGSGFWIGFPDRRTIVDAPRREILDAVRAEIDAGRLQHDTPVLHVAQTFQQWSATPLGVFTGVDETSISLEPEVSQHTVGGRLYGSRDPGEMLAQAAEFLASGTYGYVVLEPRDLPEGIRPLILAAGYESIFSNDQGEVFRIAP